MVNIKCAINSQNKNDNRFFQYAITIALNYQKINNNVERISKVKPFINNFNGNETNFPPQQQDYKKFETNNESIALNALYIPQILKILNTFTNQNLILQENNK